MESLTSYCKPATQRQYTRTVRLYEDTADLHRIHDTPKSKGIDEDVQKKNVWCTSNPVATTTKLTRNANQKMWPHKDRKTIWRNLWEAPITMPTRATWYKTIHDIMPTNQRLHTIRIAPTDNCGHCGERDTLTHQILECGYGPEQREWMKLRIASTLRTDQRWIPEAWILRPQFKMWPSQRHRATVWMITQFVAFRTQHR
jgi:hypothetical protein